MFALLVLLITVKAYIIQKKDGAGLKLKLQAALKEHIICQIFNIPDYW